MCAHRKKKGNKSQKIRREKYGCPLEIDLVQLRVRPSGNAREERERGRGVATWLRAPPPSELRVLLKEYEEQVQVRPSGAGEPSEKPQGETINSPGEKRGRAEVVVGGQSDCIDRIGGQKEGIRGRRGGSEEGKVGLSKVLQALREALHQCRCVRALCLHVHVYLRRSRMGG